MIRTQIQLSEEQARSLKKLAHRDQVSVAELIRQAIDHWLEAEVPVSPEERRRRALSIVGKYDSRLGDVSVRHDDYLDEAYRQW